jgi:hypothetical protein
MNLTQVNLNIEALRMIKAKLDVDTIYKYLNRLFEVNDLIELRVLYKSTNKARSVSTFYESPNVGAVVKTIKSIIDSGVKYEGMFVTLNSMDRNDIVGGLGAPTKDSDISTITHIPFDFDPVRPKGTASTDHQVNLSIHSALLVTQWLTDRGWPKPILGLSGNGAHLVYKCSVVASDALKETMGTIYSSMGKMFATGIVAFDTTVRNPSRIFRLYGTLNNKVEQGIMTECEIPDPYLAVKDHQIESLAEYLKPKDTQLYARVKPRFIQSNSDRIGDYRTLDIVSMLKDMGLYKRSMVQDKHSIFCPWMSGHSYNSGKNMTDTVVWESFNNRWPVFHCSHSLCEGKNIIDVINYVGTDKVVNYCLKAFN